MPLSIVTDPAALKRVCRNDDRITIETIPEMFRLMVEAGGMGLAAPQVGINSRFFITAWGEVFIDPTILHSAGQYTSHEGCLSLPGVKIACKRSKWIKLQDGTEYEGVKALVIQHELDHLNGILITDRENHPW
jgi:peptide deformylase